MGEGIKLNLGCGKHLFDQSKGWINVDKPGGNAAHTQPDVEADVFKKLPFPDDYADEIYAIHLIEHCYAWEVGEVLTEWKRVLKSGGLLVLELPCLEKILYWFTHEPVGMGKTMWGLYGDPTYKDPAMCHKWAYSVPMMEGILREIGFADAKECPAQFHMPKRDMRFEARKP